MTYATYTPAKPADNLGLRLVAAVADIARGGLSLMTRFVRYVIRQRRRQRAIATLNALDNRMLKDIGISRSEIPYAVFGRRDRR